MSTSVFVQCILCPKRETLSDHDMSDEAATKLAESRGWTVKPTVCPACNALPKKEYRRKMRERKAYCRKHKTCPDCRGTGRRWVTPRNPATCQTCHGDGVVVKTIPERIKGVFA